METSGSGALSGAAVFVGGATGQIGRFLLPRLDNLDATVFPLSRRPGGPDASTGRRWISFDFDRPDFTALPEADTLIHAGPLWPLPSLIDSFAQRGIRRVIAFGSTSRWAKRDSSNREERDVATRLAEAETNLADACRRHDVAWTLFRPTLIYGAGIDNNVAAIGRVVRRFGFFPVAASGAGLRQPVHADDLAAACVSAHGIPATFGVAYDLGGGETLSYAAMVEAVFTAMGRRPRLLHLPLPLLTIGLRGLSLAPGYRHVTPDMAIRMSRDLVFDWSAATRDFGYAPRPFRPLPPEALTPLP